MRTRSARSKSQILKAQRVYSDVINEEERYADKWRSKWALGFWCVAASVCMICSVGVMNYYASTSPGEYVAGLNADGTPKSMNPFQGQTQSSYGQLDPTLTASTRRGVSSSELSTLTTSIASLQRQLNTLQARNERIEDLIARGAIGTNGVNAANIDNMTTSSVGSPSNSPANSPSAAHLAAPNSAAANALDQLALAEEQAIGTPINQAQKNQKNNGLGIAGIDLGYGVSFDDLRTRWDTIKKERPDLVSGLEARALLIETVDGIRAHLIAGPFSSNSLANTVCQEFAGMLPNGCKATKFEGQRL